VAASNPAQPASADTNAPQPEPDAAAQAAAAAAEANANENAPEQAQENANARPASKIEPPDASKVVGSWKASPVANTTITLTLKDDKTFDWAVSENGRSQTFKGQYTYGGDSLTLVQASGTAMVGQLTWNDPSHVNFRIMGTGPDDPGLDFAR
jgi:hypothetical protein